MADPVPQAHSGGTDPSFAGGIMALIRALASSFAPRSVTDRPLNIASAVNGAAPPGQPTLTAQPATLLPQGLGHEFYQNADR